MSTALKAEIREKTGTLATKKIKRDGNIPAIIYSNSSNHNISLNYKEFENFYIKGNILTSIIELDIAGKKTRVIAHKVELDPVSDKPVHIDFMICDDKKGLRAKPKINFVNQDKSPGLKKGGFLHVVLRRLDLICENETSIPHTIEVDVGSMHVGAKFRAANLKLPAGVKLIKKDNFLIASIIGRGKSEDEKPTGADAAAAGATPAATAAKADEKKPEAKK